MTVPVVDLVGAQLAQVRARHPDARLERTADGQQLLIVPEVAVGPGWSQETATLRVIVPMGFPHVAPDCFYVDPELRLPSGAEPTNSSVQPVFGAQFRWFSWHLGAWDPASGTLEQYVRFCERRLKEAR